MTQENKELLLRDLCTRLPYKVKLAFYASATKQTYICTLLGLEPLEDEPVIAKTEIGSFYMLAGNVKPYLFPLSSMTEEQYEDFIIVSGWDVDIEDIRRGKFSYVGAIGIDYIYDTLDWLNKNNFDYRGLIPMDLAIDATDKNIY